MDKAIPTPKVFCNRTKYWTERHQLTATREPCRSGEEEHALTENAQLNLSRDSEISQDRLNAVFSALSMCPHCDNEDKNEFLHIPIDEGRDDHIQFTQCLACNNLIGVDDTMSQETVKAWLETLPVKLCSCGNTNMEKYVVCEQDGNLFLRCEDCKKEFPMSGNGNVTDEENPCNFKCKCGNDNQEVFSVHTVNDSILGIQCQVCDACVYTQSENDYIDTDDLPDRTLVTTEEAKQAKIVGKTNIKHADKLMEGDHIAWWRPEQYWHHALVTEVHPDVNAITVIHYNGPSPTGTFWVKGEIMEEYLPLDEQKGILYKMVYDAPCLPVDVALVRAATRLGEATYNFFTNNCEHFVRWCKTGSHICEQVNSAYEFAKEHAKKCVDLMCPNRTGMAADKVLYTMFGTGINKAIEGFGKIPGLNQLAIIQIEALALKNEIQSANEKLEAGHISKPEYLNIVVRNTAQCVLRGTGEIVGRLLVPMVIPIPVVGPVIGFTLGALIGHGLGSAIGYRYAKYQESKH